jgi:FkbM family methyltransferase
MIHSEYPKHDVFKETEQYVLNHLISSSQLNCIHDITSCSIFKIMDFLNIILNKFHKIICIDVGCAIGDVRNLIHHNNVFSIGIDPLIEQYKHVRGTDILNNYNILHNIAIDIEDGEKMFNITKSLDTSSLYDFNTKITTDINNNTEFYIPNNFYDFITTITEKKLTTTKTLKHIIEENNLQQDIIHILKVDAQGNDLNVVKSIGKYLKNVMFIIIESNNDHTRLYKDTHSFTEDYSYLKSNHFELITKEVLLRDDFDCLYYNTDLIKDFDLNWDKKDLKEVSIKTENKHIKSMLTSIYNNLLVNHVITQKDTDILNKWNTYF